MEEEEDVQVDDNKKETSETEDAVEEAKEKTEEEAVEKSC